MKVYNTVKSVLKNKIKLLKNDFYIEQVKAYKKRSLEEDKFFLLSSKQAEQLFSNPNIDKETKQYFYELYKKWDEYGSIPLSLGKEIERLLEDSSIQLGIHRTGGNGIIHNDDLANNDLLHNIFTNGVKNYGSLSSGAVSRYVVELNKTFSSINNLLHAVIYLKTSYKDSTGGILAAFPSNLVNNDLSLYDKERYEEIYNKDDKFLHVKPEYLLGYIAQIDGVCTFHPKEEFQDSKGFK